MIDLLLTPIGWAIIGILVLVALAFIRFLNSGRRKANQCKYIFINMDGVKTESDWMPFDQDLVNSVVELFSDPSSASFIKIYRNNNPVYISPTSILSGTFEVKKA